ncbi:Uncharacterized protein FWK35_00019318, partial [Aphis craccivora]
MPCLKYIKRILKTNIQDLNNFNDLVKILITIFIFGFKKHILDSERSDECIDFTMMVVSDVKSKYPWCIIQVKSKHFQTAFQKIEKNKKKMTEKRDEYKSLAFSILQILTKIRKIPEYFVVAKNIRPLKHKPPFSPITEMIHMAPNRVNAYFILHISEPDIKTLTNTYVKALIKISNAAMRTCVLIASYNPIFWTDRYLNTI